jgi:5-methylthioadenosine/S-adenosylhomocysteine deaminase
VSILIKNVKLDDLNQDILIQGKYISKIDKNIQQQAGTVIDGSNKAVLPSFMNGHTHAAMNLLRGFADDMELMLWLQNKIWPLEAKLTEEDVYWGSKLACLEMIKSGTTFFNDMYWHFNGTARAAEEMGMRAVISSAIIDNFQKKDREKAQKMVQKLHRDSSNYSHRIQYALGPHAIYTVSPKMLLWLKDYATEHDLLIHTHLSETKSEVEQSLQKFNKRPVEYLNELGFLGPNLVVAHAIWVDDNEMQLLAENNVKIVHTPASNMKLCSGIMPLSKKLEMNILTCLGTDGASSNNNLDIAEEMKIASLLHKVNTQDPKHANARQIFELTTRNAAQIFKVDAGEITVGKLADLILVDLNDVSLVPGHNLISDMVYSANGSCVDTTICDGNILMQNRKVAGEEEIITNARRVTRELLAR